MSDEVLTCESCGMMFVWKHEEQVEAVRAAPLDDVGFGDKPAFIRPPRECKSCREKQDQQRA